jgi:hypothetical protein
MKTIGQTRSAALRWSVRGRVPAAFGGEHDLTSRPERCYHIEDSFISSTERVGLRIVFHLPTRTVLCM